MARLLLLLLVLPGAVGVAVAGTLPSGGRIVSGSGHIGHAGNTTTIKQHSPVLSIDWQTFDIGVGKTVDFRQPGSDSLAVNRVLGNSASRIFGHLNANGQVWLINANGILFGRSARVNVGGLVASTLDPHHDGSGSGEVVFSGDGGGSIVNRGRIVTALGGYAVLIGNHVSNQGVIRARLGSVALAGGNEVTLTFANHHLMHLQVDRSTLRALVENHQLIVANGGQVLMTAGARDSLVASVVNNTGTVQARSVVDHDGTITLLAGMQSGTVKLDGTLDASAPDGGNGGNIETSGAHLDVAARARVTAAALRGSRGTWLVDPVDLTIDGAAAGTISSTLDGGTNVTEQTTASGASGQGSQSAGQGDINVDAGINWNSAATLTLDAYHDINVNAGVTGSGSIAMHANGALDIGAAGSLSADQGATLQAGKFVNHAGAAALGSHWTLYTTRPSDNTLDGLAPDFIQYAATLGDSLAATGNALIYSVAPALTISGLKGTVSKHYDGTGSATFDGSNFNASGLLNGDVISAADHGKYASTDVGNNIAVTSPSMISDFTLSHNGVPVYGYALGGSPVSAAIGAITPKSLTAKIIGDPTKVYDGTDTATLKPANYEIDGFASGQGASVNQPSSVAYDGVDAGSHTVNATFSVTNFVADTGTKFSNYILPTTAAGPGTISKAPLILTGLFADNKVYDGDDHAVIDTSTAGLYGVISSDAGKVALNKSGITGTFAQVDVGNGIGVAVTGYALRGSQAHNYKITAPSGLAANITPRSLTIDQVTAANKRYDGGVTATLDTAGASLDNVVGSDAVSLETGAAVGTFSQADVGTDLVVTTSGFSLTGAKANDYTLVQPKLSADITPAPLTITMTGTPEKTYDGTDAVVLHAGNFSLSGFVGTQHAVVNQSTAHFATANASDNITVTDVLQASDFKPDPGTSMSNYSFGNTIVGTGLGKIDPLPLLGRIVNNPTKVYDGNAAAYLKASNLELSGFVPGQGISADFTGTVAGSYDSEHAGARKATAGSVDASHFSAGAGTLLSNYALPVAYQGSGTITPAPLSGKPNLTAGIGALAGATKVSKVYDGTNTVILHGDNFTLSGWIGGDGGHVDNSAAITGYFGQSDVGTNLALSATLGMADIDPDAGTDLNDYQLVPTAVGVGDITPKLLTVTIINDPTKTYNGSVDALLTSANFSINGFASGEGGSISPTTTASYDSADAGARTVTTTLTPANYLFNAGTEPYNYTLAYSASGTGTILKAPLYITNVYATNKVYDTAAGDTLDTGSATLAGLVAGDTGDVALDLTGVGAHFSQADVGTDLDVTATGFTITGSKASNYDLQPVTGLTANITPAPLKLTGVLANDKTYNGTRTGSLDFTGAALQGVLGSDSGIVGFDGTAASATFRSADAGNDIKVTVAGITLTGAARGNYQLTQPSGLTAAIDPKPLTAVIIGNPKKVYDGTNSATLYASDYDLQGFVGTDSATIPQSATANYLTKDVGTDVGVASTLVASDFLAGPGTNLSNYVLPTTASGTQGEIDPKVIDLSGTRVYDGATDTTAAHATFNNGVVAGVNGETLVLKGTYGSLTSGNAGKYAWTNDGSGGLSLGDGTNGGLASNYTLVGGNDKYQITRRPLTATITAADKDYNGNTDATLTSATLEADDGNGAGLIAGDDVNLVDPTQGTFASRNVGTWTVTGGNVAGNAASNYLFTPGTTTATISKDPDNVLRISIEDVVRQYDGTTKVYSGVPDLVGGTLMPGDTLHHDGTYAFLDPNVGTNKEVSVAGVTVDDGNHGGNYIVQYVDNTTSTINRKVLDLSGTRVYDGAADTTAAHDTFNNGVVDGVNGETLVLNGTYGALTSGNAGNHAWTNDGSGGLSVANGNGASGGLASNYTLVGGKDTYKITKRPLTATIVATDKDYDGTTDATLTSATLQADDGNGAGLIAGDDVTLVDPTHGTFASRNVGSWTVIGGGVEGTAAANYTFTPGTTTATISKIPGDVLQISIENVVRQYDGTTKVYSGVPVLVGGTLVTGDTLNHDGTYAFLDRNVGTNKEVSVAGVTVNDGNGGGNYTVQYVDNTTSTINPAPLKVTANNDSKTYDGNAYTGGHGVSYKGFVNGENDSVLDTTGLTYSGDSQGAVDAGSYIIIPGGLTADHGNYTISYANGALTVNPKVLDLSGSRGYDGTVDADAGVLKLSGLVGTETLNLSGQGKTASRNTGTYTEDPGKVGGSHFDLNTLTLADGSGKAGNYTLVGGADTFTINPVLLKVSTSDVTRTYDGKLDAGGEPIVVGGQLFGSDRLSGGDYAYGNPNVGNGDKTVSVAGVTVDDGNGGGNYTVQYVDNTTSTISPAPLKVTAKDANKTYDGNAYTGGHGVSYSGFVDGENPAVLDTTGLTYSGNSQRAIDAGNYTIIPGGLTADHGNYTISYANGALTVNPKALDLTGSRDYDGTTDADAGVLTLSGLVGTETLELSGQGKTASRNTGTYSEDLGKVGGTHFDLDTLTLANGSGSASNYTLVGSTDTFTITPAPLTVTANPASRPYDGIAYSGGNGVTYSGFVDGEGASELDTSGLTYSGDSQGAVDRGSYTITPGGLAAAHGNYIFHYVNGVLTVTPPILTITADDDTKTYGDTVAFSGSEFTTSGLRHGETVGKVSLASTGAVATAGVTGSPYAIVVSDAASGTFNPANYTIVYKAGKLTINPQVIAVTATGTDKVYDGNTRDAVTLAASGLVNGDKVAFTGTGRFTDPNAGNGKTVHVTGIGSSDPDATNYAFNTTATTTADISPYVLDLSGNRLYDGSTSAAASLFGHDGVLAGIPGEALTLHGSGQTASKDVGTYAGADFALETLSLAGIGKAQPGNYTLKGGVDKLVIGKAPATVIADSATVTYNGHQQKAAGFTVHGLVDRNDENVLDSLHDQGGSGRNAGSYVHSVTGSLRNYALTFVDGALHIDPLAISVTATGTNKYYDGTTLDKVQLHSNGVLSGDAVAFTYHSANFDNPMVGNGKPVTVGGIALTGAAADNYRLDDPTTATVANIKGGQPSVYGVGNGLLAQLADGVGPHRIATPYGLAVRDSVGVYAGNKKQRHHVVERNRSRRDFTSGMALKVIDGGVKMPGNSP